MCANDARNCNGERSGRPKTVKKGQGAQICRKIGANRLTDTRRSAGMRFATAPCWRHCFPVPPPTPRAHTFLFCLWFYTHFSHSKKSIFPLCHSRQLYLFVVKSGRGRGGIKHISTPTSHTTLSGHTEESDVGVWGPSGRWHAGLPHQNTAKEKNVRLHENSPTRRAHAAAFRASMVSRRTLGTLHTVCVPSSQLLCSTDDGAKKKQIGFISIFLCLQNCRGNTTTTTKKKEKNHEWKILDSVERGKPGKYVWKIQKNVWSGMGAWGGGEWICERCGKFAGDVGGSWHIFCQKKMKKNKTENENTHYVYVILLFCRFLFFFLFPFHLVFYCVCCVLLLARLKCQFPLDYVCGATGRFCLFDFWDDMVLSRMFVCDEKWTGNGLFWYVCPLWTVKRLVNPRQTSLGLGNPRYTLLAGGKCGKSGVERPFCMGKLLAIVSGAFGWRLLGEIQQRNAVLTCLSIRRRLLMGKIKLLAFFSHFIGHDSCRMSGNCSTLVSKLFMNFSGHN